MKNIKVSISIKVDEKVYLKDPESTELGRKIVKHGIELIDELGLESFTFKKLAEKIGSTEATVYRYFISKHMLLIYLISWYWNWLEYRLVFATNNITSPEDRLKIAIRILSGKITNDQNFSHIDEAILQKIVVAESAKAYLTKEVDENNKEGFFHSYKRLCKQFSDIVLEINPNYKYPASLFSTISESAHFQNFFAHHLPSLTNVKKGSDQLLIEFLTDLVFSAIENKKS
ncbi:MAG: TetR/AcrR family transcriptional regulator [Bacteroidota bacterium]|nr:TetR/AcrR family transcriptional regulator [Bacteroidota bacterium]